MLIWICIETAEYHLHWCNLQSTSTAWVASIMNELVNYMWSSYCLHNHIIFHNSGRDMKWILCGQIHLRHWIKTTAWKLTFTIKYLIWKVRCIHVHAYIFYIDSTNLMVKLIIRLTLFALQQRFYFAQNMP